MVSLWSCRDMQIIIKDFKHTALIMQKFGTLPFWTDSFTETKQKKTNKAAAAAATTYNNNVSKMLLINAFLQGKFGGSFNLSVAA